MKAHHAALIAPLLALALAFLACGGEKAKPEAESEKRPADAPKKAETAPPPAPASHAPEAAGDERAALARTLGIDLSKIVKHPSGIEYVVRQPGTGAVPKKGERIRAHYTGYLLNGKKFDSSVDRGQPFETNIGVGQVIRGWDIAFTEMKVGEKRVLFLPPDLAYGASGIGGVIPPNATLVFDVELLGIVQ
jgi:peptidylprolyl isomerase